MSQVHSICLMTALRGGDIEQFATLRRSLRVFAPGFPHVAIVNTEHHAELSRHFHQVPLLRIVSSADVLPRALERRRHLAPLWANRKWRRKQQIPARRAQQLIKLYALAGCPYDAAVFIDADVLPSRQLAPDYFFVDGRLKLFRRRAVTAECLDLDVATHDILGNPLHRVTELYDYSCAPACFRKSTAVRLLAELERHKRSRWLRRFLAQQRPSEYNLLGYAATALEGCADYQLIECDPQVQLTMRR